VRGVRKPKSVAFNTWFPVPRGVVRKNETEPETVFDRFGPPEMRLFLHLLKLRRDPNDYVEANTLKLRKLVGLYKREFERARDELVKWELITATPVDARKETYRYSFTETGTPLAPMPDLGVGDGLVRVPIPREQIAAVLSPEVSLDGRR
jgi:hypothetical protein